MEKKNLRILPDFSVAKMEKKVRKLREQIRYVYISPFKFIYTMLPHGHNGPFICLVILNSLTLTRKL
jgi:hypothetical protein